MRLNHFMRRRLRVFFGPALSIFLIGYFVFHMVQGNHGLIARDQLLGEVEEGRSTLEALRAERMRLEAQADRLNPRQLDLDLLDERSRVMLNLAHPNDLVVPLTED